MSTQNSDNPSPAPEPRDEQVFVELQSLGMQRYKEKARADAEQRFAGASPAMLQKLKTMIGAMDQIGFQLAAKMGIDPHKVDFLAMARLQKAGYLTAAEIARFSPAAQEKIKQLLLSPESDVTQRPKA